MYKYEDCRLIDVAFLGMNLKPPAKTSHFRGMEYLFYNDEKVAYANAAKNCSLRNATLLIIKDNATQQHIVNNLPKEENCKKSFYYIGLFRGPDRWFWPDNSTFYRNKSFQRWRNYASDNLCYNEPNGYRGCSSQNGPANATQILACANFKRGNLGDWFDKNQIDSKWYYICQRPYAKGKKKYCKHVLLQSDF